MKKMFKKNKILGLVVSCIIIIFGIFSFVKYGFNKDLCFSESKKIEIAIPTGYEKSEIEEIASKIFNNEFYVEKIEKLNQVFGIRIREYSSEELETFKEKVSQKYGIDVDNLQVEEIDVPSTRVITIISAYIAPIITTVILCFIYFIIRNFKNKNLIKASIMNIILLIGIQLIYFSIILIFRIKLNNYTMPICLLLYILTLFLICNNMKENKC